LQLSPLTVKRLALIEKEAFFKVEKKIGKVFFLRQQNIQSSNKKVF